MHPVHPSLKTLFLFACNLMLLMPSQAQDTLGKTAKRLIILDFLAADFPYQKYAAKTAKNCTDCKPGLGNYLEGYANPSMAQSLALSSSLYSAAHTLLPALFTPKPTDKAGKAFIKRFAGYLSVGLFDNLAMYSPLGNGWLHEEFHRAVMTRHYVKSFDEMNSFPLGRHLISVNHETDESLARFKQESNPDFVRMQAAGIEGEYLLVDRLQKDNFFYRQNAFHTILYWINTVQSVYYVSMCSSSGSVRETRKQNEEDGNNIASRDFTGLDLCGWAYDLERPDEPYAGRGIHPSGVGINRYRTADDFSPEQLKYLKRQGNLQLLNFVSPMMFGFRSILLKKNAKGEEWRGNFAVRDFLTSFGNDISLNVFYQSPMHNVFVAIHNYNNYNTWFPGLEAGLMGLPLGVRNRKVAMDVRAMVWDQPEGQRFKTGKGALGGLASLRTYLPLSASVFPYVELEGKTRGWVAGNVFLNSNISARLGCKVLLATGDQGRNNNK